MPLGLVAFVLVSAVCGGAAPAAELTPRLVGGMPTTVERWPWQVAITIDPQDRTHSAYQRLRCGGALVAPTLVLTAAHCLYDAAGRARPAAAIGIVTGRTSLSSRDGRELRVRAYRTLRDRRGRPLFDYGTRRFDVALVQLAGRSRATPIHIAGPAERRFWRPGRRAYLSGWGRLGGAGPFPDNLHVAALPITGDAACRARFGRLFSAAVMLCAGSPGTDACSRDSGDPLVVRVLGGRFRLVGDMSWGDDPCGRDPGVYGRLADEPIRSMLQRTALEMAGADIIGSGSRGTRGFVCPAHAAAAPHPGPVAGAQQ